MDSQIFARHRLYNALQSLLLATALAALLGYLAWVIGGEPFVLVAVAAVAALYFFNPAVSPQLVLRMFRGMPIAPQQAPQLHDLVEALARRARLPRAPRLYLVPGAQLNAFAVGTRARAAIALSEGLLRGLSLSELAGVVAHELAHIRNNDMRVMGFADLATRVTRSLSLVGQLLVLVNLPVYLLTGAGLGWLPLLALVFAPMLSALAQLALSRNREFDADLGAAELLGDPRPLVAALHKLEHRGASLFERMFWPGQRDAGPSLLRTHPPIAERIGRLRELAPSGLAPLDIDPPRATGYLDSWLPLHRPRLDYFRWL